MVLTSIKLFECIKIRKCLLSMNAVSTNKIIFKDIWRLSLSKLFLVDPQDSTTVTEAIFQVVSARFGEQLVCL